MEHLFQDTPIAAVLAAGAFAVVLPPLLVLCRGKNKRRVKIVNDQDKQRRRGLLEGREQTSEHRSTRSKRDKDKSRSHSSRRPLSDQENAQPSSRSQKYNHLFTGFPFKKNPLSQESTAAPSTPAEPDRGEHSHRSDRRERSESHRSHSSKRSHRHRRSIEKEERTQSSESDRRPRSRRGAHIEDTDRDSNKQQSSHRGELSKKSDQRDISDIRKSIRQRIQSDSHRTLSAEKSASSRTPTGPEEKKASRKNTADGEKDKSDQSCVKSNSVDVRSKKPDNASNSGSFKVTSNKQAAPKASKRTDADTSPTGVSREKSRQKPPTEHRANKHHGKNHANQPSKPARPPNSRTDDSKGTATSDGQLARRPKKQHQPAQNGTKLKAVETWDRQTGKDAKGHGKPVKPAKKSSLIGKLFRTNKNKDGASKPGNGKNSKHGNPATSGKR